MAVFSKSLRNWTKKHDFIEGLRNGLPQNTQNSQNLLLRILPQISDAILGGALVSARLCRLPEQEVHQPSKQ